MTKNKEKLNKKNLIDLMCDLIIKNKEIYVPDVIGVLYPKDNYKDAYKKITCLMWAARKRRNLDIRRITPGLFRLFL